MKNSQKDKDKKIIYLYASDREAQYSFIESAKERGYDVLLMDGVLDNHFINHLEQKLSDVQFKRVDADTVDKLIEQKEQAPSKLDEKQKDSLKPVIERNINKEKFTVQFENMSETDLPAMITQPEFMRRMKDMSAMGGGSPFMGEMPDQYNLVINANNAVVGKILEEKDEKKQDELVKQVYDLALLSQNLLKGEALTSFIKRSVNIIK